MKIVLWIGNEPNQKALANKIHGLFPLTGIVTETRFHKRKITLPAIVEKVFLSVIGKAWWGMKEYYTALFPDFPNVSILNVENINSEEAFSFTQKLNADLIIVSGTRLIRKKMLSLHPKIGILNLHTGLSPYIKGGPNCTNWCIATGQYHLIGNTIMWIDAGIDSGNIITTEFTELNGTESLNEIHIKVMEHAHSLYLKAIKFIAAGNNSSVAQSLLATGKTYFTKDWTLKEKIQLIRNLKKCNLAFSTGKVLIDREPIITVKI